MRGRAPSTRAHLGTWVAVVSVTTSGCLAEGLSGGVRVGERAPACALEMPLRRLTPTQYAHAIHDLFEGRVEPSPRFPGVAGRSDTGFTTELAVEPFDRLAVEEIMAAAEDVAAQIPEALPSLVRCPGDAMAPCLDAFLEATATRAFRRPLTPDEHAMGQRVASDARADGASPAEAAALVVAALLQAPQFLYVVEAGELVEGDVRRLSPYEVATRLALLLWDSIPDDALLAAAREGRLDGGEQGLESEARRMLADPKAARMAQRFFREWLHVAPLAGGSRDPVRHPWFDETLAASMGAAFDAFAHAAVQEGWTVGQILTTARAPVDAALAELYDLPAPGAPWAWTDLDPRRAAGVMTQPAVMASLASWSEASYVKRGHVVVAALLCRSLGGPPANATTELGEIARTVPAHAPRRELSKAVRGTAACGSCHRTLDPPGLAFENFDATGRWREVDASGLPVDPSGEIEALHLAFDGPRALMEAIAARDDTRACFERQLFRYFASRLEGEAERCALERLRAHPAADGSVAGTWRALVASAPFLYRRAR